MLGSRHQKQNKRLKIFISFATPDHLFVRRLLARLAGLGLEAWDYSDEGQELDVGSELLRSLAKRIESVDVCIPVISTCAFGSRSCQEEVRYALPRWAANQLRLFPLVSTELSNVPSSWPDPYSAFSSIIYHRVDFQSGAALEVTLKKLCDDFDQPYLPPIIGDERLPFMQRFTEELEEVTTLRSGREGRGNSVYRRLMEAQQDFEESVKTGDYLTALERVTFVLLTCEYEFPSARLYYPYIAKAVCQIATGHAGEAITTLRILLEHPRRDENLFGALGYIMHHQGEYQVALRYYQEALRYDRHDAAIRSHVLLNSMLCRVPIDTDDLLHMDESSIHNAQDRRRLRAVTAVAMAYVRRLREAQDVFLNLLDEEPENVEVGLVIQFAEVLIQNGKNSFACKLLDAFQPVFADDAEYLEYQGRRFLFSADPKSALAYYQKLVALHPHHRRYRVEEAVAHWLLGQTEETKAVSKQVLEEYPIPVRESDFYYNGLANWLLGHLDRAEYDFRRSKSPPQEQYEIVLLELKNRTITQVVPGLNDQMRCKTWKDVS